MNFTEPSEFEVFLTWSATILTNNYRRFVRSMKLSENENILEYGSGSGNMSVILAKELKDGTLTCLDISKKRLQTVSKILWKFRKVNYILGDLTGLELRPAYSIS